MLTGVMITLSLAFAASAQKPACEMGGWKTSRLVGSPEPPLPYTVERIYGGVALRAPIYVVEEPGSDFLIVIQERAPLLRLPRDPGGTESSVFAEFPDWLVYGLVFDPDYAANGYVYLFLHGATGHVPRGNRIARFTVARTPEPRLDPASELRIIEWASGGHDGGDLAFGGDGLLYITTGDGSGDSDTLVSGQTLDDLLGAVLRVDVRGATAEKPYTIPEDNPFLGTPGARGEIWAYGLRNPWRMSIDRESGQIWVGNNGQDLWETAHLVRRGDNFGWSVYEGSHPFYPNRAFGPTPHVPPTIEHHHSAFRSLTGGVVYRGEELPELAGVYIYGDYSTGRIWGVRHDGERMEWHRELADTPLALAAFRSLPGGDLLMADHLGHALYRLVKNPAAGQEPAAAFPAKLSDTGIFWSMSGATSIPQPGVHFYELNAPAWNDGAEARRWMAVPEGGTTGYADQTPWAFPDGTALVQTLFFSAARPVETRILLRQQNEWSGFSYRWNDEGSDAELVDRDGLDATLADGRSWRFASRTECTGCHNRAANYVLGIQGAQLNRPGPDGSSQLHAFAKAGLLQGLPDPLPDPWPNPHDPASDLDARARTYLHVNCAVCHVESGGGNARINLGRGIDREAMQLVGARPQHSTFALPDAMLVKPGAPESSVLAHRIARRGPGSGQMPPLGTGVVDSAGVALIGEWIAALPPTSAPVRAWTMDDFPGELPEWNHDRQFLRGKDAFVRTGCAQCHRIQGEGGSVGPDLAGVGDRLGAREMLESILDPSRSIAEGYVLPGTDPPISAMPPGMVNVLAREEVLDLVYYLKRDGRPRVAAIVTEYRHNSHADMIVSRLLQTDTLDGKGVASPLRLASLYTDQRPPNDTSRALAATHGFPVFDRIADALTLGTGKLAVDGVLLIAEHGDYPVSATGNHVYPKRRFWDEILTVFQSSGRSVPVFIDKHLADNWDDAKFIHDSAAEHGIPLMAGSSLPTTWRKPAADVDRDATLREIVALTYHTTDAYGFHALEAVQALAEQRKGGASGIVAVESVSGEAVWRAFDEKRFDPVLFEAAWSRLSSPPPLGELRTRVADPRLFTVEYADGLRAHLLELNGAVGEWSGAWRYADDRTGDRIGSTLFWTQEGRPGMHFTWLLHGFESMMLAGKPNAPCSPAEHSTLSFNRSPRADAAWKRPILPSPTVPSGAGRNRRLRPPCAPGRIHSGSLKCLTFKMRQYTRSPPAPRAGAWLLPRLIGRACECRSVRCRWHSSRGSRPCFGGRRWF